MCPMQWLHGCLQQGMNACGSNSGLPDRCKHFQPSWPRAFGLLGRFERSVSVLRRPVTFNLHTVKAPAPSL
eukprot:347417-Chlamydomonas_euryale.AAC.7